METVKSLNKWANRHTSYPIDLLRIALGVFLLLKGISFITNNRDVADVFSTLSNFTGGMFIFTYVAAAHIMGGVMIAFGLLTRWAIWAQLPILIGAVVLNFVGEMNVKNLMIAFITLIVCVFFLIYGSGKHSADYYFKMQK
ncbi:MAG: DoxX family protein [Flavobacterium sp.]|nr:MAG: DoxX family protein [Flavobacterium sp.]